MSKKLSLMLVVLLVLFLLAVGCGAPSSTEAPKDSEQKAESTDTGQAGSAADDLSNVKADIRWASASLGSTGQVLLTGITTIVGDRLPGVRFSVLTTSGSQENPRMLQNKEAEFAAINADSAWPAFEGKEPFDQKIEMMTLFSTFGNQVVFITMKDSGITSMEQLKGKKVSVGPPGSGGLSLAQSVLRYGYNLWDEIKPVYLNYNDQGAALKDGTVDAMMAHLSGGAPAPYLAELDATSDDLYILGQSEEAIKKIQEVEPFQTGTALKPEVLRNLDREILTMANYNIQYTRPDIPEDVVYAVVKTFYEDPSELGNYHQLGKSISIETALQGAIKAIPVHPGAAKYYKEKGVWNDELTVGTVNQ